MSCRSWIQCHASSMVSLKKDENEEKRKILKSAAAIIRNGVNLKKSNTEFYPPGDNIFQNINENIPESL